MSSQLKKHLSPWIAWSLVALFAGISVFSTWYYYFEASNTYDDSATFFGLNVSKNKTTTAPSTIASTSATADWKTYTNNSYRYTFKYPKDWILNSTKEAEITLNSPENEATKQKIASGQMYGEGYMEDISFYYYDNIQAADSNRPKKYNSISDMLNDKSIIISFSKTILDNQTAYDVVEGGFSAYYAIIAERNNHIYKIFFGNVNDKIELTDIEKQILSTFQFTK